MKRTIKNLFMIVMIVALGAGAYFTMDYAGKSLNASAAQSHFAMQGSREDFPGTPPDMGERPSMPEGGSQNNAQNSNEPPSMPEGGSQNNAQNSNEPPSMPEDSSQNNAQNSNEPPSMPEGGSAPQDNFSGGTDDTTDATSAATADSSDAATFTGKDAPPDAGSTASSDSSTQQIDTFFYVLLGAEMLMLTAILAYLVLSGFNKKDFYQTFNNAKVSLLYALTVLVVASALTCGAGEAAAKWFADAGNASSVQQMMPGGQGTPGGTQTSADATGATTVDGSEQTVSTDVTSTASDESAVLVTNGGAATISGASISKSGDSTNTENSEFYGVNAAVLVQSGSSATITDATISTDAKGANAVFATGENAKITVKNTTITTTGASSSRGLDATYGGTIEADNVTITTQGGSCATLATDRGEGTVTVTASQLETNGRGSPVIYSTGDICITDTTGTANGSQNIVIEGKNSATVKNSTLTASGKGNRNDADNCGVMIYQSMSGDAGEGTGTLTATDSTLAIQSDSAYYKTAPMFFITNTDAVINLNNVKLDFGSGVLLSAKATDEWGKSGANGGNVTLNAENQTLAGNIEADSISAVTLNLTASSFEGAINTDNTAKEITLTLDAASAIKLTGDTYVTALEDADSTYANIDFNGYTLYVNGTAVNG